MPELVTSDVAKEYPVPGIFFDPRLAEVEPTQQLPIRAIRQIRPCQCPARPVKPITSSAACADDDISTLNRQYWRNADIGNQHPIIPCQTDQLINFRCWQSADTLLDKVGQLRLSPTCPLNNSTANVKATAPWIMHLRFCSGIKFARWWKACCFLEFRNCLLHHPNGSLFGHRR